MKKHLLTTSCQIMLALTSVGTHLSFSQLEAYTPDPIDISLQSDHELMAKIQKELEGDANFKNVNVRSYDGFIIIDGVVSSEQSRQNLKSKIRNIQGVRKIEDRLEIIEGDRKIEDR